MQQLHVLYQPQRGRNFPMDFILARRIDPALSVDSIIPSGPTDGNIRLQKSVFHSAPLYQKLNSFFGQFYPLIQSKNRGADSNCEARGSLSGFADTQLF